MDPLSDLLSLLKPSSFVAGGFDIREPFSASFAAHEGIKCYAIVSGHCWLAIDGLPAVHLTHGDCFLMARGRPFRLTTDLALTPVDALPLVKGASKRGGITLINGGGTCFIAGGFFLFDGSHAAMLLSMLPPVIHLRKESDKADMRWSLERLRQELLHPCPGSSLIVRDIAHMLIVQALRVQLANGPHSTGWLSALADKQICAAITALHENPGYRWTLQGLSERAGMSRSIFALKFKELVGIAPMEYLTQWRMMLAADRLVTSNDPLAAIALSLGYQSESAFSTAFKRHMGSAPRLFSRTRASSPPAPSAFQLASLAG